jgi:7-cyano-7-deazaguanine synthase
MNEKVISLLSGGLDSSVLLALAIKNHGKENVTAVSIYYGQRHVKEIESAKWQVEHYGVDWKQIDLSSIFQFSDSPLLQHGDASKIENKSYEDIVKEKQSVGDKTPSPAYVPYRNGLFLSVAAAIAQSIGASKIYYGAHLGDLTHIDGGSERHSMYPDCSGEFVEAISKSIFIGTGDEVFVEAPYVTNRMNKGEVVKMGIDLGVDFSHTWSCYRGGDTQCGACPTCQDRKISFKEAGISDPTVYST